MKQLIAPIILLSASHMTFAKNSVPNDLVNFLTGKWDNISFEISNGKPVKREEYPETMVVKDASGPIRNLTGAPTRHF